MTFTIRKRLTFLYAALVSLILALLGFGVFVGTSWGLRNAADQELSSGIDGVAAFLRHKLGRREMNNLNDELREHSALLPRGKMFRVSDAAGATIYQPDAMSVVASITPQGDELRKQNVVMAGRSYRTISRFAIVGPYRFLIQVAVDQSEYQDLILHLSWMLIFSIPLGGILAAATGYWMSGRALSPIQHITKAAGSIDARSLTRRLPIRGTGDELDCLSSTINHMLDRIAASYEGIAQFTADASHELRTPVALIRSNAELLLMGANDASRVEQGLLDILHESDAMTRLIADLLTLARSGVEDASINMELFEMDDPVIAILPRARAQAARRQISIYFASEGQIAAVRGNQKIIERILMILIDNAVRYTPPEGNIWITRFVSNETCGFSVRDSGIGISRADQERIFERFFRVDSARTPRDGGSGLGLSIAKSLIELHGGTIRVESDPGHGTCFEVTFPRADIPTVETEAHAVL